MVMIENPVSDDSDHLAFTPEEEEAATRVVAQAGVALDAIKMAARALVPVYSALLPLATGLYTSDALQQVIELFETLDTFAKAARRNIMSPDLDDLDVNFPSKAHRQVAEVLASILGKEEQA